MGNRTVCGVAAALIAVFCVGLFYGSFGPETSPAAVAGGYYDEFVTKYGRDQALSRRFAEEISAMVLTIAAGEVSETSRVRADIFVKQRQYPADAAYSTDMEAPLRLHISFRGDKITETDFVDRCVAVREAVLARGFPVDRFGFDYRWSIGREGFGLDIEGDDLTAGREALLTGDRVYCLDRYDPTPGDKQKW